LTTSRPCGVQDTGAGADAVPSGGALHERTRTTGLECAGGCLAGGPARRRPAAFRRTRRHGPAARQDRCPDDASTRPERRDGDRHAPHRGGCHARRDHHRALQDLPRTVQPRGYRPPDGGGLPRVGRLLREGAPPRQGRQARPDDRQGLRDPGTLPGRGKGRRDADTLRRPEHGHVLDGHLHRPLLRPVRPGLHAVHDPPRGDAPVPLHRHDGKWRGKLELAYRGARHLERGQCMGREDAPAGRRAVRAPRQPPAHPRGDHLGQSGDGRLPDDPVPPGILPPAGGAQPAAGRARGVEGGVRFRGGAGGVRGRVRRVGQVEAGRRLHGLGAPRASARRLRRRERRRVAAGQGGPVFAGAAAGGDEGRYGAGRVAPGGGGPTLPAGRVGGAAGFRSVPCRGGGRGEARGRRPRRGCRRPEGEGGGRTRDCRRAAPPAPRCREAGGPRCAPGV
jgi:hypothetical protein